MRKRMARINAITTRVTIGCIVTIPYTPIAAMTAVRRMRYLVSMIHHYPARSIITTGELWHTEYSNRVITLRDRKIAAG
jgi:hypothetical protein